MDFKMEGQKSQSGFIKNIFICVSKMHESLGLKWHEGKLMTIYIFGWTKPLEIPQAAKYSHTWKLHQWTVTKTIMILHDMTLY